MGDGALCFGADGSWSDDAPANGAQWRLVRSYGNTVVFEITSSEGDLEYRHERTVSVRGDALHDGAAVFHRVEGRVESCGAQ